MTAKQKKFILNKLIPFILREQGRGFVMQNWKWEPSEAEYFHSECERFVKSPKCGTTCCIGGSIEILLNKSSGGYTGSELFTRTGEWVGLNRLQSENLFHVDIRWPSTFKKRFGKYKTPLGKAKVAAALLREVVRTNGKCLDAA